MTSESCEERSGLRMNVLFTKCDHSKTPVALYPSRDCVVETFELCGLLHRLREQVL
jgi:hypothetical protein